MERSFGGTSSFIAGGTDLVIQMARGQKRPAAIIDLMRLKGLAGIRRRGGMITIGALATHKAAGTHTLLGGALEGIREAARVVGGHQVRNIGTVGGNVANASPAADVVPVLLALDAEVVLSDADADRILPLGEFILGPRRTARRPGEIITSLRFAAPAAATATAFVKAGRRKAMEIAVVNVAVRLTLDANGACRDARIALGSVGPTVLRARRAEASIEGEPPDEVRFREAGRLAMAECSPISDVRASARYRSILVAALVERALATCAARAAALATPDTLSPAAVHAVVA